MNWRDHVNSLIEKDSYCEAAEYLEQELANNSEVKEKSFFEKLKAFIRYSKRAFEARF